MTASLILRTLTAQRRITLAAISEPTLRRLYKRAGLDRQSLSQVDKQARRRWETHAPNVLWYADVCHGPALRIDGRSVPLRVHAIFDDHSRYIVAIQVCATERESEMLLLMVKALRLHPAPDTLYFDNGATYSGKARVLSVRTGQIQPRTIRMNGVLPDLVCDTTAEAVPVVAKLLTVLPSWRAATARRARRAARSWGGRMTNQAVKEFVSLHPSESCLARDLSRDLSLPGQRCSARLVAPATNSSI